MNKFIKNYLYNLSYQILVIILPLITTPYISRVLGADGVGKFNYAYAIVSVSMIIAQLGTSMYGQREIAFVQKDKIKRSITFWNIFIIRALSSVIVIPLYILLSFTLESYTTILIYMLVYLIANLFDISWFFQGMEEFKKTAIRNIYIKIIGVILIFIFVKSTNDIVLYTVILSASQLIGNIILWFYLPSYLIKLKITDINIKKHIMPILELFIPTAATYIYTYVDKIILGIFSTESQVGFYSQSEKIIKLLMTIVTALGSVLLPHIAFAIKNQDTNAIRKELYGAISFVIFIGLPMVIGCILIADIFIPWFLGDGYEMSIILFQLLSPLIVIIGLASVVGQAVLVPLKKQRIYTISIVSGAIINLIFNLILIPFIDAIGAAIGTLIAEITVTTIQFTVVKKTLHISLKTILKNCKNYFIGAFLIFIIGILFKKLLPNITIFMFIMIIALIIIYLLFMLIRKDNLIKTIFKKKEDK